MRRARQLIEEISRGLTAPVRGEPIVDYADGQQGTVVFADRVHQRVHAKFGRELRRVPFRSLRWDTTNRQWIWWGLREGHGQPGYDVPLVYRVSVSVGGKRHVRDVEVVSRRQVNWARARGLASILRDLGYAKDKLRFKMASLMRDGAVTVADASLQSDPESSSYITFRPVSQARQLALPIVSS